jgi:site-specific recombinase XerD
MVGGAVMTLIAPTLQAFFTDRLIQQRQASPQTIASYRDTLRLLLTFVHQRTRKMPAQLDWDDLDAITIAAFLNHLESERHNSTRTRNLRLTAIRSLFSYAALRHPEHALLIQRVLAIPPKRFDKRIVTFLTATEVDALLAAPDQARWEGRRDRALMLLAIQAGLRVSEITSLNCNDITLRTGASVRCQGKGRKQRAVPLTTPSRRSCGFGSANEPDTPTIRSSRPAPDGGSAAMPSRCGSPPTPRLPHSDARRCSAKESTHTSCATAAPCPCCKQASTPR